MSGYPKIKRRCVFCGKGEVSLEDIWPKWMLALLKDRLTTTKVMITRGTENLREAASIETTVKRVCESCNNGWMSVLEEKAKPLLTPMIMGDNLPVTRTLSELRILATWGLKTYLMLNFYYAKHERFVPGSLYSQFFRRQLPPQQCAIWIAAHNNESINFGVNTRRGDNLPTAYNDHGIVTSGRAGAVGVICTFYMHRLIYQVMLMHIDRPIKSITTPGFAQLIWPLPHRSIDWPIRMEAISSEQLQMLAERDIDVFFPR
jgi:hypothetical protein